MALKRARSPSLTAPPDEEDSTPIRASKFQRTEDEPVPDIIWCKLPPTCSLPHSATACRGVAELEAHYAHFHAFVCQAEGCSCVFDREHYLNLVSVLIPSRTLTTSITKPTFSIKQNFITRSHFCGRSAANILCAAPHSRQAPPRN